MQKRRAQIRGARERQVSSAEPRQNRFCRVCYDPGLDLLRLGHLGTVALARCPMRDHPPDWSTSHLKHLLDLPDLADEEPVRLLRQNTKHKAVVLIACAREGPQMRPVAEMHAV